MRLTYDQKKQIYENGYVVIPGVVPEIMVEQALKVINHALGKGDPPKSFDSSPSITGLFNDTPAKSLIESVMGDNAFHPIQGAQVALRYPTFDDPAPLPHPHLDGMLKIKDGIVQNFTALVGVFLSDLPTAEAGNFTVFPGTHRNYEQYFREHGPEILLQEDAFETIHHSPNVTLPNPVPITGRAGDIIICHYQLAHAVGPNIRHNIRYACFYRIDHRDRQKDWKAPLTNIWMHWPGMKEIVESDLPE